MADQTQPLVSIIMGSQSDLDIMKGACSMLEELKVPFEVTIVSAHRTPKRMVEFAENARSRGIKAIIAGAGGAAHLPGMVASMTTLPVIGVPVKSTNSIDGWDSLLSIVQMPSGVPVATVAVNGAKNAGILAAQMLGGHDEEIANNLQMMKDGLRSYVEASAREIEEKGYEEGKIGFKRSNENN